MNGVNTPAGQSGSVGGAVAPVPAFGGASRDFSSDRIDLNNAGLVYGTGARTFAFWMKSSTNGGAILSYGGDNFASGCNMSIAISSTTDFGQTLGALYVGCRGGLSVASDVVSTGSWVHCAVTYSGGGATFSAGLKFYKNGVLSSKTSPFDASLDTIAESQFYERNIGAGNVFSPNYIAGKFADFRVYNRVLTAGEIVNLRDGVHIADGLLTWMLLDADDVLDNSGNGNDGANVGSAYHSNGPFRGWETPIDVSTVGDSIVSTEGILIEAKNLGWASDRTVNGVLFTGQTVGIAGWDAYIDGNLYQSGTIGSDFEAIMDSLIYAGHSITLTGLTVGNTYLFQAFIGDDRAGIGETRTLYLQIQSHISDTKFQADTPSYVCRFVATGSTQSVIVGSNVGPIMNGYQLRQLD